MADEEMNGNAPFVIQAMNAIRAFIRDVGTPITILVFVGLIYTGVLKSPLTAIDGRTKRMAPEMAAETSAIWALYGVLADVCAMQPNLSAPQRAACYKILAPPKCADTCEDE